MMQVSRPTPAPKNRVFLSCGVCLCRHLGLDMGTADRFAARGSQGSTALFFKLHYCFLQVFNTYPTATAKPETHISTEFFYLATFPVPLANALHSKFETTVIGYCGVLPFFLLNMLHMLAGDGRTPRLISVNQMDGQTLACGSVFMTFHFRSCSRR